jgi:hypothetical protein
MSPYTSEALRTLTRVNHCIRTIRGRSSMVGAGIVFKVQTIRIFDVDSSRDVDGVVLRGLFRARAPVPIIGRIRGVDRGLTPRRFRSRRAGAWRCTATARADYGIEAPVFVAVGRPVPNEIFGELFCTRSVNIAVIERRRHNRTGKLAHRPRTMRPYHVADSTETTLNVCILPSSSLIETYSPGRNAWAPKR